MRLTAYLPALALATLSLLSSDGQKTHAANAASGPQTTPLAIQHRATVRLRVAPGRSTARSVPLPRVRGDWDQLVIRIAGKLTPVADYRSCSLDAVRHRIMVTIDACHDGRLTVTTATTGKRGARVKVRLTKFATGTRSPAPGGQPSPSVTPTPTPTEEPDSDVYVPPEPEDCAEEPDLEGC